MATTKKSTGKKKAAPKRTRASKAKEMSAEGFVVRRADGTVKYVSK